MANSEEPKPPGIVAELKVVLLADGHVIAETVDPALWSQVMRALLEARRKESTDGA